MIEIFSASRDEVIKSSVSLAQASYEYALAHLYPLIDRFQQQRKLQSRKFYSRLRKDIVRGCIMPPITLAFVHRPSARSTDIEEIQNFISKNIESGYILDGMQRLNTLHDASNDAGFDSHRPLPINVIITERYDLLLYRMITLNNGQKPMTARHQIEMLTKGLLDTSGLGISVITEKDTEGARPQGAFKQGDVAEAYTAYLTDSVHNQNSRIIESKLDEILVGKVMESNIGDSSVSFQDVLIEIDRLSQDSRSRDWLRNPNNLVGFTVGFKISYASLRQLSAENFAVASLVFEQAFEAIDVSKVNVGKQRRELSKLFIEKISQFREYDRDEMTERFFEATMID